MKNIKMPSIEQFNTTIKNLQYNYKFIGLDEDGKAQYDETKRLPTLKATGSVKLHGTNASIMYDLNTEELQAQKKSGIITPEKDNYGFAFWVQTNSENIKDIFDFIKDIPDEYKPKIQYDNIILFGEWAGKGIQKSVGISEFEKSFYIFGIKVSNSEESEWINPEYIKGTSIHGFDRIYNIWSFVSYDINIDLDLPSKSIPEIEKLVKDVEDYCPVTKVLEILLDKKVDCKIGEGIVWWLQDKEGNWVTFKTKGEKHSKSKVKTIKKVDSVLENKKIKLAEKVTPGWRLNQGIQEVFGEDWENTISRKRLGEVLKWVFKDIIKEELQTIADTGLTPKDINGYVAKRVKEHFFITEKECLD